MLLKSTILSAALFFSIGIFHPFSIQAEVLNGPTVLKDKAFGDLTINGPANLHKVKAKSLTVNGPLKFSQLDVQGPTVIDGPATGKMGSFRDLTIKGPFHGKKITLSTLKATGPTALIFFTITGNSIINGPLKAKKGRFQNLTVGPDFGAQGKVSLEDVTIENLTIKTEGGEETLELGGDSDISGKITFESKKGKVEKKISDLKIKSREPAAATSN